MSYNQLSMSEGASRSLYMPLPPQVGGYIKPAHMGPAVCGYNGSGDFWSAASPCEYGHSIKTCLQTSGCIKQGCAIQGCAGTRDLDQSFADLIVSKPNMALYGDDLVSQGQFALQSHALSQLYDLRCPQYNNDAMRDPSGHFGGLYQGSRSEYAPTIPYIRNNVV
jgi:hypothetical protein